ncbi:hypothetical protein D3C76_1500340 [compost metagenome]
MIFVRVPGATHVLDQPLGHVQFALVHLDFGDAVVQFEGFQPSHLFRPAQGDHDQGLVQRP